MKRKIMLISLLVFISLALFATGRNQSGTQSTGSLPFVEFDWYTRANPQPDQAMVFEAANRYIQEKINARINFVTMSPAEWPERMPVMINSGAVNGVSYFVAEVNYIASASRGAFLPLDDLLDRYGAATKALFKNDVWDGMKVNGRIYGVPTLKDNSYIIGAYYNATMAEQLGITVPSTLRYRNLMDLEPLLMEVIQKRKQLMPQFGNHPVLVINLDTFPANFALELVSPFPYCYAVMNMPGIMEVAGYDTETVFNLYETPEFLRYAQTMARYAANDIINTSSGTDWNNADGGFFLWPSWGEVVIPEHYISTNFVTKAIPPARTWTSTEMYHAGQAIAARTRDPDRAMKAINLMNTDPTLRTMMSFGIEGQHYIRDSQGRMVLEGSPRNSDPANRGYLIWYGSVIGNVTIINTPESYGGPNNAFAQELINANNNAALGHMGFVFDPTPVEQYIAACNAVTAGYIQSFMYGLLPESQIVPTVAEFTQSLRAAGVQNVINEAQRQLNAWKATRR